MRFPAIVSVLIALLALPALAPAISAGHAAVYVNPCENRDVLPPVGDMPGCRDGQPIPGCWSRDGGERPVLSPLCPDPWAAMSCLAIGLYVSVPDAAGFVVESSRSEAAVYDWAGASASAETAGASTALASAAALPTECSASTRDCLTTADAAAADVSLLGGFIVARALESHVGIDCFNGASTDVRFATLEIGGVDYGPIVHHSVIVIPGVGTVTTDDVRYFGTPGGYGVQATALRVDLVDVFGNPRGTILVGHSVVISNY